MRNPRNIFNYDVLSFKQIEQLEDNYNRFDMWLSSDNVVKIEDNLYVEQSSQYRIKMTLNELYSYFIKEFINQ